MAPIRPETCSWRWPFFQLRSPMAVPIQRVPSDEPSKETTAVPDRRMSGGGVHGWKRTPSNLTNPESVPIQMYPSVVCVIALGADSNAPSCTRQAVCRYCVMRTLGSSALAGRLTSNSASAAAAVDVLMRISQSPICFNLTLAVHWCSSAKRPEARTNLRNRIHGSGGNHESHLGTHSGLAPDLELAADQLCPLAHARQTEAPGAMAVRRRAVDPQAVITDTKLKLAGVVPELHFNPTSACVPEGIAHGLAANPIDIVADDRPKASRRTLDCNIEAGSVGLLLVALRRRELVA